MKLRHPRGELMCPFCLTTVGLIVAGSVSTSGLAALAVKISRKKNSTTEIVQMKRALPMSTSTIENPKVVSRVLWSPVEINPRHPSSP
jgi:hypothetical protein